MGLSASGKSTYIEKHFPNTTVVDLYDFQQNAYTLEAIKQSYEDCKNKLIEVLKEGKDVVLEHTMYRAIRRKIYIDAVRSVTDASIDMIYIQPTLEELEERWKKREIYVDTDEIKSHLKIIETPTLEEGFHSITIVKEN
jgi:predicted kinase